MKTNSTRQREEEVFTILRTSLSRLNLPMDLVEELIERHIAVAFEKGALVFCEGNTDGMLACIRGLNKDGSACSVLAGRRRHSPGPFLHTEAVRQSQAGDAQRGFAQFRYYLRHPIEAAQD